MLILIVSAIPWIQCQLSIPTKPVVWFEEIHFLLNNNNLNNVNLFLLKIFVAFSMEKESQELYQMFLSSLINNVHHLKDLLL